MSCLSGCLLFIDGIASVLFFRLFRSLGLESVGRIGALLIASPIWIWLIKSGIRDAKKASREAELEREQQERERNRQREIDRRNTACLFRDGITKLEFEEIARRSAKRIKRLHIDVDAPIVNCEVDSQSGISTWEFTLDFNDFGHITGTYWITKRGNYDSSIPNRFAELMQEAIEDKLKN